MYLSSSAGELGRAVTCSNKARHGIISVHKDMYTLPLTGLTNSPAQCTIEPLLKEPLNAGDKLERMGD